MTVTGEISNAMQRCKLIRIKTCGLRCEKCGFCAHCTRDIRTVCVYAWRVSSFWQRRQQISCSLLTSSGDPKCDADRWEVSRFRATSRVASGALLIVVQLIETERHRPTAEQRTSIRWFVHRPLLRGLLHLVQRWGASAGCGPAQSPPRCTKCNSPPIVYDTIRYDSVYLTCSKKLTLSLPHGTNKKLKCKTKNKMMSVIGPASPVIVRQSRPTSYYYIYLPFTVTRQQLYEKKIRNIYKQKI